MTRAAGGHAERVFEAIEASGAARSRLVQTWRRSAEHHGLDPAERRAPDLLTAAEGALAPRPAADLLGRDEGPTGSEKAERAAILRALVRAGGNVSAAARALGVGRATLYRQMRRLGIDIS